MWGLAVTEGLRVRVGLRDRRCLSPFRTERCRRSAPVPGRSNVVVAQIFNLPYRGFSTRRRLTRSIALELATLCRLQIGDTAEFNSALQGSAVPLVNGIPVP